MQTELLSVTGMTCSSFTSNVTKALKAVTGVGDVNVSLAAGEAKVQFDEQLTSPERLRYAVQRVGYGVGTAGATHSHANKSGCCG